MIYIELTDMEVINYFASILINMGALMAPLFGALSLTRL